MVKGAFHVANFVLFSFSFSFPFTVVQLDPLCFLSPPFAFTLFGSFHSPAREEGERVIVTHEKSIDTDERSQVKGKKAEKK